MHRFVVLIMFATAALGISAGPLLEVSRETPGYHAEGSWSVKAAFVNDSWGIDHSVEWDDGRTAAFEIFLRTPVPLYVEIGNSFLTNRGDSAIPGSGSRIDEVHFVIGGIIEEPLWGGRGRAAVGIGGLFFGNFAGYHVQSWSHELVNQERPIPPLNSYDDAASSLLLSGEAGLTNPWSLPAGASLAFAAGTLGYWSVAPALWFNWEGPYSSARFGGRFEFAGTRGLPPTAELVFSRYEGPWIDLRFAVHGFFVKYAFNPVSRISQGILGINLANRSGPTPNPSWMGDFRLDFSITPSPHSYLNRSIWSPPQWQVGQSRFGVVLDIHTGWRTSGSLPGRFQTTLLGGEWAMPLGRKMIFEPFGSLSAGYSYTKRYNLIGGSSADLNDEDWLFTTRVNAGLRFTPYSIDRGDRVVRYSFLAGALLDGEFGDSVQLLPRIYFGLSVSDLRAD